jgi:uncharacterized alkaline shock family protein YloU
METMEDHQAQARILAGAVGGGLSWMDLEEKSIYRKPDVIALVGRSGTGKSHRASFVANEIGADLIIDDGLVVQEGRILAGRSAKREDTKLAAVRRAIFSDSRDAREAVNAIRRASPRRILVLGTSHAMVSRICRSLSLPYPSRVIEIEEVSTVEEINRALRIRRDLGKHVIPAPTFEVKKTFSGYLVDPLHFLLRPKSQQSESLVIEKSVVRPTYSSLGRFFIADTVISSICHFEAKRVQGVAGVLRCRLEGLPEGITIDLDLVLKFGVKVVPVLTYVQERVREAVEFSTSLNVLVLNVAARRLSLESHTGEPGGDSAFEP